MGSKVSLKQWALAAVAVFIAMSILSYLENRVILTTIYPEPAEETWRNRILIYLGRATWSGFFTFIFALGYEAKPGIGEGLRYGLWIGLFLHGPWLFSNFVTTTMGAEMIFARGISGIVESVLCGILAAVLFRTQAKTV